MLSLIIYSHYYRILIKYNSQYFLLSLFCPAKSEGIYEKKYESYENYYMCFFHNNSLKVNMIPESGYEIKLGCVELSSYFL